MCADVLCWMWGGGAPRASTSTARPGLGLGAWGRRCPIAAGQWLTRWRGERFPDIGTDSTSPSSSPGVWGHTLPHATCLGAYIRTPIGRVKAGGGAGEKAQPEQTECRPSDSVGGAAARAGAGQRWGPQAALNWGVQRRGRMPGPGKEDFDPCQEQGGF